jgi:hypothetical protein
MSTSNSALANYTIRFEHFTTARKKLLTKIATVMGKTIVISNEAVPEDSLDSSS